MVLILGGYYSFLGLAAYTFDRASRGWAPSGVQTRTAKDFGPARSLENPFAVARNQNNYVSPT